MKDESLSKRRAGNKARKEESGQVMILQVFLGKLEITQLDTRLLLASSEVNFERRI